MPSLGRLDVIIAQAEREKAEQLQALERLATAKKSTARAKAKLRVAEDRLALLHGSRQWLLAREPPMA